MQMGEEFFDFGLRIFQIMFVAFVGAIAPVGTAIFVIDQTDRFNTVDEYRKLYVFQDHFVIMYAACQRNDVKVIVPKTDRDPRLDEFLQAIVHAVDNKRIAMNDRFFSWHDLIYL